MNTVLDENRKLCLVSGAIIEMSPTMTIMFEVEDLEVASPATVSRCGMIYMDPVSCVPLSSHIDSWCQRQTKYIAAHTDRFVPLFKQILEPALEFIRSEPRIREYVPSTDPGLILSFFKLLDCLLVEFVPSIPEVENIPEDKAHFLPKVITPYVIFAVVWSVGATSDNDSRKVFNAFMRGLLGKLDMDNSLNIGFPEDGLVYDFVYDSISQQWTHWLETIDPFEINPTANFKDIVVPTTDTVRYNWLLEKLIVNKHHVLCIGPTGTGKSLTISEKIMNGLDSKFIPLMLFFSARTSANQTQQIIDGKLEKQRRNVFGPPAGKGESPSSLLLVVDMNSNIQVFLPSHRVHHLCG